MSGSQSVSHSDPRTDSVTVSLTECDCHCDCAHTRDSHTLLCESVLCQSVIASVAVPNGSSFIYMMSYGCLNVYSFQDTHKEHFAQIRS